MSAPDPAAASTSSDVLFRIITPVFAHSIDGGDRFTHSGRRGAVSFELALLPYQAFRAEVFPSYDPEMVHCLQERQAHLWDGFAFGASHFLLTDETHTGVIDPTNPATAPTPTRLLAAALDALRLHCSAGLAWHHTYVFARPKSIWASRMTTMSPGTRQKLLGRPESMLHAADFAACRRTIDLLLAKTWSDTITSDMVLRLAMEYQRLSFTLERVDHAFLILMVAYEAMFKRDWTENASKAAQRIGRLLGETTRACKTILKEFDSDPDSYSKIRNRIAHGDPTLNLATVTAKYPSLYRHVTAAVITLLNLPPGSLDQTKDYYAEIGRYANDRFNSLLAA